MSSKAFVNGFVALCAGFLASRVSSLLEAFPIFGAATVLLRGVADGLAVVAFGVAIFMPVPGRAVPRD
ncbi:MAG: hypothetical protein PVG25_09375 [Anaerolineae bacterium]|jgi:hypothetical protein